MTPLLNMDTSDTPNAACVVCSKPANTVCAGCADGRDAAGNYLAPTRYCGNDCQTADWPSHRTSCRAAQPTIKLFRTGQLLQECFLATRAEAFDLCVTSVERAQDGTIHFFDKPAERVCPISLVLTNDVVMKDAVLSWGAGRDVFAGLTFELIKQALKGCTIEEMDVDVIESRISTYRYRTDDPSTALFDTRHHILRVTLKDKSIWAVDIAGAQHAQHNPVVPFADYARDSIATILGTRPFGTSARNIHDPINTRNPCNPSNLILILQLSENLGHQIDELAEWEYHHLTVPQLLKAKREAYQSLKAELVQHLATQAREYVKLCQNGPSSTARSIVVKNQGVENMSDEDKARMERKRARAMAGMDAETRRVWEEHEAEGTATMMFSRLWFAKLCVVSASADRKLGSD